MPFTISIVTSHWDLLFMAGIYLVELRKKECALYKGF